MARQGQAWSSRERALARAFGGLLSHTVTLASRESALLVQRRLDELVGMVAERLMSASVAQPPRGASHGRHACWRSSWAPTSRSSVATIINAA